MEFWFLGNFEILFFNEDAKVGCFAANMNKF